MLLNPAYTIYQLLSPWPSFCSVLKLFVNLLPSDFSEEALLTIYYILLSSVVGSQRGIAGSSGDGLRFGCRGLSTRPQWIGQRIEVHRNHDSPGLQIWWKRQFQPRSLNLCKCCCSDFSFEKMRLVWQRKQDSAAGWLLHFKVRFIALCTLVFCFCCRTSRLPLARRTSSALRSWLMHWDRKINWTVKFFKWPVCSCDLLLLVYLFLKSSICHNFILKVCLLLLQFLLLEPSYRKYKHMQTKSSSCRKLIWSKPRKITRMAGNCGICKGAPLSDESSVVRDLTISDLAENVIFFLNYLSLQHLICILRYVSIPSECIDSIGWLWKFCCEQNTDV